MVLKNQKWYKMLGLFFENPDKTYTVRKISKKTRIPTSSVQRYLKILRKYKIIKDKKFNFNSYSKFVKTYYMIDKLYRSGLLDFIEEKMNPSCIILFGGVRKGEYDREGDIDIFVESSEKHPDLSLFEKKLKHKIDLFIESSISNLPKLLLNNVVNGIKLYGSFKV